MKKFAAISIVLAVVACCGLLWASARPAAPPQSTADEGAQDTVDVRPAASGDTATGEATSAAEAHDATDDILDAEHRAEAEKLIQDGIAFLLSKRDEQGGWSMEGGFRPALTALALKALLQQGGYDTSNAIVKKGFEVLLSYQRDDGGIYDPKTSPPNYTTAVAIMALVASGDPQFKPAIGKAVEFLRRQQIAPGAETPDGQTVDKDHPFRGGVSYGQHGRPDLSNLGMWMQAMHDAGVPADDPAMKEALVFLERVQNRSESNPMPWAAAGSNDGGFVYAPAVASQLAKGESKAGAGPGDVGLRSYGSMTYVGFKSLLYAGLARDDPRVQAAYKWIRTYWRLDSNPNMPQRQSQEGLYYYYHAFAKALRAWGEPVIKDTKGVQHNWREELIDALARRVNADGSWTNPTARWGEADPVLATCYSVLALEEALKK